MKKGSSESAGVRADFNNDQSYQQTLVLHTDSFLDGNCSCPEGIHAKETTKVTAAQFAKFTLNIDLPK